MEKIIGRVESVHSGSNEDMSKEAHASIQVELIGIVGDKHRSFERSAWAGWDKQPEGTIRRNERQWSAVSAEELVGIQKAMGLTKPLTATCIGANLCLSGISELSRLPKGTIFKFASGVVLSVEEYNHPCNYMSEKVASLYKTHSGDEILSTAFSKAAKLTRGIVGVVEVAGEISAGEDVTVEIYAPPSWLKRSEKRV